jgi:EmrB/QacA subfamily drug resistance transporter
LLAAVGLGALAFSLAQTSVLPALPAMQRELDAGPQGVAWVVTAYLISAAVVTPIAGRLGDMFGKRRVLLMALAILTGGSALSAVGGSLGVIIAGRVVAGVGAAGVLPLAFGLLREGLSPERLPRAIGLVSASMGVGAAFGLLLGGFVIDLTHFRWIFILGAGISATAVVAVALVVRESRDRPGGRVDVYGTFVLAVGLAVPLVVISEANDWGWLSARTVGLLAVGFAILVGWIKYQQRSDDPLIDISTLAHATVAMTNVATVFVGFGLIGAFILIPQLAQAPPDAGHGLGLDAGAAALITAPGAVAMFLLGPVAGMLGAWAGNKALLAAGCVITGVGLVLLAAEHASVTSLVGFGVVTLGGVGVALAAMPNLIVEVVPPSRTGEATGINVLMRLVGASLGSQVIAAVLASSTVGEAGLPQASAYTAAFLVTAGAAFSAAVVAVLVPTPRRRTH